MQDYKLDIDDKENKYLYILQDNQPELDDYIVVDALKHWLNKNKVNTKSTMFDYPEGEQFQIKDLVYHNSAFKIMLDNVILTDIDIYESMNRILEYNLRTYDVLYKYLKKTNWKSNTDYLRLRPYLLKNIDLYKIMTLYNEFNLVDPAFMNKFYNLKIIIDNKSLDPDYFGYRKAWYYLYYLDNDKMDNMIEYMIKHVDCSYSALVHYILWLKGINTSEYEQYYDELLHTKDVKYIHNLLIELEPNKEERTNEIIKYLNNYQ